MARARKDLIDQGCDMHVAWNVYITRIEFNYYLLGKQLNQMFNEKMLKK